MTRVIRSLLGLGLVVSVAQGCGPQVDLAQALKVTDAFTGWYDAGIEQGANKLVPSISFRLQNVAATPINEVALTVSFWQDGADGEWDSKEVRGIGADDVAPGQASDPVLVRASYGYTIEAARADVFTHSQFKDVTAKIFAKRGGRIVPLGEFRIDRRVIPRSSQSAGCL